MPRHRRVITFILLFVCSSYCSAAAPLRVVTSIRPLQLLAVAVTGNQADVQVLLDPRSSPHDYQLRPSDRARLEGADVVFWVGPALEHFLQPALKGISSRKIVLALDDGVTDPHIWMDPIAMQAAAQRMAAALAKLRPAEAQFYYANVERISAELVQLDHSLRTGFVQSPRGYIVEHDAYQRFETRYGLRHLAAITDASDLPPSVSGMLQIREMLASGKVSCVLAEPHESAQLRALMDGHSSVRIIRLDPMAVKVQLSLAGLLDFYRQLGESISECLAGRTERIKQEQRPGPR